MNILLKSGWQSVNIGDIAHTLGFLAFAEKNLPNAKVTVWVSNQYSEEAIAKEYHHFPDVKVLKGEILEDGTVTNHELDKAINECDFLLHNSGPMLVALDDVAAFMKKTNKPYGVFGITYDGSDYYNDVLSKASFLYLRDSVSLSLAREKLPFVESNFGPDIAFSTNVKDEDATDRFLSENNLQPGKFLCCITRLRYTPYWLIKPDYPFDPIKNARNEEMKEHDNRALIEAITAVVRQTGYKVLVCPEDSTQIAISKEVIIDKLPNDVLKNVVWRQKFWFTDEALSVYCKSAGVFGNEMHSPIMCVANGIPAIVCRHDEQTSKGYMWSDIGLSEWLFNIDDDEQMKGLVPAVLDIVNNPLNASKKVKKAMEFVMEQQTAMANRINLMKIKS